LDVKLVLPRRMISVYQRGRPPGPGCRRTCLLAGP